MSSIFLMKVTEMLYETKGGKAEKPNIYSSHGEAVTLEALRTSDKERDRERESFILDHVDLIDRSKIEKKTFLKSTIDQSS